MELLEVLITHYYFIKPVPGCTTELLSVPTTADTIAESMRPLLLLWNGFGYWNNQ
jgi:hypothetical protein